MVEGDGERVFIGAPEFLKQHLGLAARIDEDERHLTVLDGFVDFRHRETA